jgi:hypothetical protein
MAPLFSNAGAALDAAFICGYSPNHRPEPRFTERKKENRVTNRIRLLAIGIVLAFALPAIAQESATASIQHMPTVDQHLKALSEKLDLTAEQQEKARPILKEMQDSMQKVMNDTSATQQQMHEQMRSAQLKADKELRGFLTEEQKKKLDELESHSHPELRGER